MHLDANGITVFDTTDLVPAAAGGGLAGLLNPAQAATSAAFSALKAHGAFGSSVDQNTNASGEITVNFPAALPSIPLVVTQPRLQAGYGDIGLRITNVTVNGFTVRSISSSGAANANLLVRFMWIAVY